MPKPPAADPFTQLFDNATSNVAISDQVDIESEVHSLVMQGYTRKEALRHIHGRISRGPHSFLPQSDDDITEL